MKYSSKYIVILVLVLETTQILVIKGNANKLTLILEDKSDEEIKN